MNQENKIKIGFISIASPNDKRALSGTSYKVAEQLSKIGDLKWIPIKENAIGGKIARYVPAIYKKLTKKNIYPEGIKIFSKIKFKKIKNKDTIDCDVLVVFFSLPVAAHIKTDKSVVQITDGTFPCMLNYYPAWSNLPDFNVKQGTSLEKEGADNSDVIIYSSQWAADSAIKDLQQDKNKIKVVEFGANVDDKDINVKDKQPGEVLNLLFLGVDWDRKGGDIALQAVEWLNKNGIKSVLNIVGIRNLPDSIKNLDFVNNYGFLNKNNNQDYNKLTEIIHKSDLLLLPTKAECSAIVFSESSAYGLPILTHNTGGIPNYVIDGVNGYKLPIGSSGENFGKKIKEIIEKKELPSLSKNARKLYEKKLNWNVWRDKVSQIVNDVVNK